MRSVFIEQVYFEMGVEDFLVQLIYLKLLPDYD